jgi:hypothetical protein
MTRSQSRKGKPADFNGVTKMAAKRKTWQIQPAKKKKATLPESLKAEVQTKADNLVAEVLKPKHVRPPRPDEQLNYVTEIGTKWYRHYFYFVATYACPSPNAISPTFEQKFARMVYVGDSTFALSYMRHTDDWFELFDKVSVDECMKSIRDDPWFIP